MHIEDGRVYFNAHDEDVLNNATLQEAKHRLEGDRRLLWEAIGPDALPSDPIDADNLEMDIAAALVSDDFETLGRLVSAMALEYAFRSCHDQIVDDWQEHFRDDDYEER